MAEFETIQTLIQLCDMLIDAGVLAVSCLIAFTKERN